MLRECARWKPGFSALCGELKKSRLEPRNVVGSREPDMDSEAEAAAPASTTSHEFGVDEAEISSAGGQFSTGTRIRRLVKHAAASRIWLETRHRARLSRRRFRPLAPLRESLDLSANFGVAPHIKITQPSLVRFPSRCWVSRGRSHSDEASADALGTFFAILRAHTSCCLSREAVYNGRYHAASVYRIMHSDVKVAFTHFPVILYHSEPNPSCI